jgi:ketosteroid isomerase-like protein
VLRHDPRMDPQLKAAMATFRRCTEERDTAAAEAVLDDEFALVLVQPMKATVARARWLEVLPDYVMHDYEIEESAIDVDGDVAVALHRDRMSATVLGEDRSGTFIITDVWRHRSDGWRVWRRHSTPMSAGNMPGA